MSDSHNVDFDFFDDPPDSSQPPKKGFKSPSPTRRRSPSPTRSRSRSVSSRSRSRSPSISRSRSRSSSRSRSRSRSVGSDRSAYSDGGHRSPYSAKSDRSRTPSPPTVKTTYETRVSIRKGSISDSGANKNEANYDSDFSVDSDVTDVSPLTSPRGKLKSYGVVNDKPPKSNRPTSAKQTNDKDSKAEDDSVNMKLLMEVLELEQDDPYKQEQLARARKVLFVPPGPKAHDKKNYSFSNDQVRMIDRENQRLMEKLMKSAHESHANQQNAKRKPQKKKTKPVITPSALNRQRQQQKIEQENLALLKRLQSTRATKTLRRDQLLHEYQDTMIAGQSVAAAHASNFRNPSDTYTRSRYDENYEMSNFTEPATVTLHGYSSKGRSRPTSASTVRSNVSTGQRPGSAKFRPTSAKNRPTSASRRNNDNW